MSNELVLVSIGGVDYGAWDTYSGGARAWANVKRRKPLGGEHVYTGRPTTEDVTVTVAFRPVDRPDLVALVRTLNTADVPPKAVVTRQPRDDNGQVFGKPTSVDRGRVGGSTAGDVDITSDDPQMLSVTVNVAGRA